MDPEGLLYFLAGIGLVFFGIRQFSQSLQSITGPFVRFVINQRTDNLLKTSFLGAIIALFTQNSIGLSSISAAYVNAGLLSVAQSLALIFGAQIGFTSMAWFFSFTVGYQITFFLLFLGLAPSLMGNRFFVPQVSKCFFGVGLVLLGMQFVDRISLSLLSELTSFTALVDGQPAFLQNYLIIFFGSLLLTSLTRSKLFVLALAFAFMKSFGFSHFFILAYISGMSVGASLPGLFTSEQLNIKGKKSVFGYFFVESLVAIVCMVVAPSLVAMLEPILHFDPTLNMASLYLMYTILGLFLYNILQLSVLSKVLKAVIPSANYKESKSLRLSGNLNHISTALAIDLVEQEVKKMSAMVQIQLDLTRSNLVSRSDDKAVERKVSKYEKITDNIYIEIDALIERLMQRSLLEEDIMELRCFSRLSKELESTADASDELIQLAKAVRIPGEGLPDSIISILRSLGTSLQDFYIMIFGAIMEDRLVVEAAEDLSRDIEKEIKRLKALQKELISDSLISSDTNQSLFEIQSCFYRTLKHSKNILTSVNERRRHLDKYVD